MSPNDLNRMLEISCRTDANVLIIGENGTGAAWRPFPVLDGTHAVPAADPRGDAADPDAGQAASSMIARRVSSTVRAADWTAGSRDTRGSRSVGGTMPIQVRPSFW